jgi:hypothetical protein
MRLQYSCILIWMWYLYQMLDSVSFDYWYLYKVLDCISVFLKRLALTCPSKAAGNAQLGLKAGLLQAERVLLAQPGVVGDCVRWELVH